MGDELKSQLPSYSNNLEKCFICFNITPIDQFIQLPHCGHFFCKECLQHYAQLEIPAFHRILKIKCPDQTCTQILPSTILQQILEPAKFRKYQKHVTMKNNFLEQNKQPFCPGSGCGKPLEILPNTSFTLCICGIKICNQCCNPWHEGKNCLEALDEEFETYMQENNVRFCFMCKTIVARVEGCIHITCPICDYEWCWVCGREYNTTHMVQNECCKYWNPIAPAVIMKEKKVQKKNLLLQFLGQQIFWPIFLMNVVDLMTRGLMTNLKILLWAIILNTIYIWVIFFQTENLWALLGILAIPWILKGLELLRGFIEQSDKRWMLRKKSLFNYTTISQPNFLQGEEERINDDIRNYEEAQEEEEEDLGQYVY